MDCEACMSCAAARDTDLSSFFSCLLSEGRSGELDRGIHPIPILPGRFFPRRPTDTDCRSPGMRRRKEGRSIQHPLISQLDMPTRSGRRWRGRHFQLGQKNGNHRTSHSPSSVRPQTPPRRSRPQTKDGSQSISAASKIVGRTDRPRTAEGEEILSTPRYEAEIPFQWVFHLSLL